MVFLGACNVFRPLPLAGNVVIKPGSTGSGRMYPYASEGTWVPVGVSSVFRVNKYGPGQHFGMYIE